MSDDQKPSSSDAFLPLPTDPKGQDAAADLARKKLKDIYAKEPDVSTEAKDIEELGQSLKRSKHQEFLHSLINSGKTGSEIQAAWHEYYSALSNDDKHEVWQEFYAAHGQAYHYTPAAASEIEKLEEPKKAEPKLAPKAEKDLLLPKALKNLPAAKKVSEVKKQINATLPRTRIRPKRHIQSILFGLGAGTIAVIIILFSFFNERFIAPLIQPSRNTRNIPLIDSSSSVSSSPEVIIPKINVEIPVVYGVNTIDESAVDNALEQGVVHYADTADPGEDGNAVFVGHSSNNILNPGKYKFAFVLLNRLTIGDTFYLQKDGKRYTYQIYDRKIVKPTDVSILGDTDKTATATLVTCDPPGTSLNRLAVIGQQISPDPITNAAKATDNVLATQAKVVPGNSQTLWSRLWGWFSR